MNGRPFDGRVLQASLDHSDPSYMPGAKEREEMLAMRLSVRAVAPAPPIPADRPSRSCSVPRSCLRPTPRSVPPPHGRPSFACPATL